MKYYCYFMGFLVCCFFLSYNNNVYGKQLEDDRTKITSKKPLTAEILNENFDALANAIKQIRNELNSKMLLSISLPIGSIIPYAGGEKLEDLDKLHEKGWLPCMGQELERIDYLDLFNVIRYTWGRGEGTKFKLPDLRGLFLRGAGQNSENEFHYKQGKNYTVGKMQLDTMKSHDHNVIDNGHFHKIKLGTTATHNDGGCAPKFADCNKGFHPTSELTKSNTQIQESKANIQIERQGSEESRPKNAAVNFLIKFK